VQACKDVRVSAGYTFTDLTGVGPEAPEVRSDEITLDIPSLQFQDYTTFSYAGSLLPIPHSTWSTAIWIEEIPRIQDGIGWLFRGGRFTTEPPSDPIEIVLAPEQIIGNAELNSSIWPAAHCLEDHDDHVGGARNHGLGRCDPGDGTDTQLPKGDTFTYKATMQLWLSSSLRDITQVIDIRLTKTSLSFSSGVGQGFVTAWLNLVSGIINSTIAEQLKATIRSTLNTDILSSVATKLNLGVPSTLPAGVVLSLRVIVPTTRTVTSAQGTTTTESAMGFLGALAAFGGVLNKFPALTSSGGGCFIATAAAGPDAFEVQVLRAWRDGWLRQRIGGAQLISLYERWSPPLAQRIANSPRMRAIVRRCLVTPAAWGVKKMMAGRSPAVKR
jgi:hypothetical protein